PGEPLVEDVQVEEVAGTELPPVGIDVVVATRFVLHDGGALAEVAGISPAFTVDRLVLEIDVEIAPVVSADGAASTLEVAAPGEPVRPDVGAVEADVPSLLVVLHGGAAVVEPERP